MARAHSIWVLTTQGGQEPAHAFTVKHDLLTFMRRHAEGLTGRNVFKLSDGPWSAGSPVSSWVAADFLSSHG